MRHFYFKPEVAGGLGVRTEMDRTTHPPVVSVLHYVFDGWSGDALVTSFPCYIGTAELRNAIEQLSASGVAFGEVETSRSEMFDELFGDAKLPEFYWFKICGLAGLDDFGIAKNLRLVVSERVLEAIRRLGAKGAFVSEFER